MKIWVKWVCVNTRESAMESCPTKAPLMALKVVAMADLPGLSPSQKDQYVVKKTTTSPALDETKSLEELGITTEPSTLYLVAK